MHTLEMEKLALGLCSFQMLNLNPELTYLKVQVKFQYFRLMKGVRILIVSFVVRKMQIIVLNVQKILIKDYWMDNVC